MPDDDLSFGELCYRLGASPRPVRKAIARLKIEPRRIGSTRLYTRKQVARIAKDLRKVPIH